MRFNRVLLIFPEYKRTQFGATHPPVGLGYLSEFLTANSIENDVADMRIDPHMGRLKTKIRKFKPDLIGFSIMTLLHRRTYDLIEKIKKAFPNIAVVAGGPHNRYPRGFVVLHLGKAVSSPTGAVRVPAGCAAARSVHPDGRGCRGSPRRSLAYGK